MLSLRSLARAASRTPLRPVAALPASRLSMGITSRQSQFIAQKPLAAISSIRQTAAAFSTSHRLRQANEELVAKLQSEIGLEKESRDSEQLPEHIRQYLEDSPFKLEDTPGNEEVVLTREYNGEKIRVTFSVADINDAAPDDDEDDDAMYDDDDDLDDDDEDLATNKQSGGANTKGAVNKGRTAGGNIKVAPQDSVSPADRDELDDESEDEDEDDSEQEDVSFPARITVVVEKPGDKGALSFDATLHDGEIVIESLEHYADPKMAEAQSAQGLWDKKSMYTGPPFGNLDEDLQLLFERYLDERGINTSLALFVPEYIDFKEQKEYVDWLTNIKKFVE